MAKSVLPGAFVVKYGLFQDPGKEGFSKGGFSVESSVAAKETTLRAPQPREAYILQKNLSKNPLFLVPDSCTLKTLRAKSTPISEPRFSIPCEIRFFPLEKEKMAFVKGFSLKRPFPFLAWEKSHLAGDRKSGLTN